MLMDALEDETEKVEEANNLDQAIDDIMSIFKGFVS
jgi:hypothetical protein